MRPRSAPSGRARTQPRPTLVYGAIAVALLLLGARWLRSDGAGSSASAFGERPSSGGDESFDRGGAALVVHVAGEVRDPGVYELPAGSRVTDAVKRAGGATAHGRARCDQPRGEARRRPAGDRPGAGQRRVGGGAGPAGAATAADDGPISLGSATVEQLDTIEGIGPVTAQDIVDYRDQHGGISSIDELDQISGIGPATMEALRARLQP